MPPHRARGAPPACSAGMTHTHGPLDQATTHILAGLLQDLQHVPFLLLGTRGIQNRAHRGDRTAVLPDHLAYIFLCDPQFDDDRVLSLNPVDSHLVWLIHNRFGNVFDQLYHRLCVTSLCYSSWLMSLHRRASNMSGVRLAWNRQ